MMGNIYTSQRCPVCAGKMVHDQNRDGCYCGIHPEIQATKGFFVKFGRQHFKRFRRYDLARQHLDGLRFQKYHSVYDPRDWKRDNPLGFETQAKKWLEFKAKTKIKRKTLTGLKNEISRAIKYFGQTNVKAIKEGQVEDFIYADHRTPSGDPIASKTRHNIAATLRLFFVWFARREEIEIPDFPAVSFELGWRDPVDIDTQQRIIAKVRELVQNFDIKIFLGVKWLAESLNVRPGEMIKIKEGDILLDQGIVLVRKTKEQSRKHAKYFMLEKDDIKLLKTMPKALPDVPFFRHSRRAGVQAGTPYGVGMLYKWCRKACEQLEVQGATLYSITRHSTVTALGQLLSPEEIKRGGTEHGTNKAFERYYLPDIRDKIKVRSAIKQLRGEVVKMEDRKVK